MEVRYRKQDGEVRRVLDPLGLVLKAGVWYLVALSGRTRSLRTFRVSRVVAVKDLDEEVVRPVDFDLATHWGEAGDAFFETMARVEVRVRMRARPPVGPAPRARPRGRPDRPRRRRRARRRRAGSS